MHGVKYNMSFAIKQCGRIRHVRVRTAQGNMLPSSAHHAIKC
jgi:hypothetical protein